MVRLWRLLAPVVAVVAVASFLVLVVSGGHLRLPQRVAALPPTQVATVAPDVTPVPGVATSTDPHTPPAGYAQSCAANYPWGSPVSTPFVCINLPANGSVLAGGGLISGYAGGASGNAVTLEWQVEGADGAEYPPEPAQIVLTYSAPDVGMPGTWHLSLSVVPPAGGGTVHVTAYLSNPQDGSRLVDATADYPLGP